MGYIHIIGYTYINPRQIVSIDLETKSETRVSGEYTKNAEWYSVETYVLVIKMSNGDTHKESFNKLEEAKDRRENLYAHW